MKNKSSLNYKEFLAKLLIVILLFNSISVIDVFEIRSIYAAFLSGAGTVQDPYIISTREHLDSVRDNLSAHYKLQGNIDMQGTPFTPIGSKAAPFTGSIDGAGYTIRNLNIDLPNQNYVGLIVSNKGEIKNLGITNSKIIGNDFTGFVAVNEGNGTIKNCYSVYNTKGQNAVGSIAGANYGKIENTYTNSNVYGSKNIGGITGINLGVTLNTYAVADVRGNENVGDIAGINEKYGTITNAVSVNSTLIGKEETGSIKTNVNTKTKGDLKTAAAYTGFDMSATGFRVVTINGYEYATLANVTHEPMQDNVNYGGGLGTIESPYKILNKNQLQNINKNLGSNYVVENNIDLKGAEFTPIGTESNYFTGRFAGNNKIIYNLMISGNKNNAAMFAYNDGIIEKIALNNVNVSGNQNVAGLVGYNGRSANLNRVYVTGKINGNGNVAGLIGTNESGNVNNVYTYAEVTGDSSVAGLVAHNLANIENSYSVSTLNGKTNVGILVGNNEGGTIKHSYGCATSGDVIGKNTGTLTDVSIKTSAELQTGSTFSTWDFSQIWDQKAGINSGYPYFRGNENILIQNISISPTTVTLQPTETKQLVLTVTPTNATLQDVDYSSSDTKIATVDANGLVKAVADGEATITATSKEGGHVATATIKVGKFASKVNIVNKDGNDLPSGYLAAGDSMIVKADIFPAGAIATYKWTSENPKLRLSSTTDQTIEIYADDLSEQDTTVDIILSLEAKSLDGSVFADQIYVNITQRVRDIELNTNKIVLDLRDPNSSFELIAKVLPENANDKSVNFDTEYPETGAGKINVTKVGSNAIVTPVAPGKAKILVKSGDLETKEVIKEVEVEVKKEPIAVDIFNNNVKVPDGENVIVCEENNAKLSHVFDSNNVTDNEVVWSVDNLNILDLNIDGTVTPKKQNNLVIEGSANVTVQTKSANYQVVKDTIQIYTEQHATGLKLNKSIIKLPTTTVEQAGKIFVEEILPKDDVTRQEITWTSSDKSIVDTRLEIGLDGKIDYRNPILIMKDKPGSAVITATITDGIHNKVSQSVNFTTERLPEQIDLNHNENFEIYRTDSTIRLKANVLPADTTNKLLAWDTRILNVDGNIDNTVCTIEKSVDPVTSEAYLDITPHKKGSIVIVAKSAILPSVKKVIEIKIKERPTSVTIDRMDMKLATHDVTTTSLNTYNKTGKITATVWPADASYKNVKFASLDENIATVDSQGNVTAVKGGKTKIEVYSELFPDVNIYCDVEVKQIPTGVEILDENLNVPENKTIEVYNEENYSLKYNFLPKDVVIDDEFKTLTFNSLTPAVANIDSNGVILVNPGTEELATMTVKTLSGGVETFNVKPKQRVQSVKLDQSLITIKSDETYKLNAEILPAFAYNHSILWTSSNPSVATVDQTGLVTAVGKGTANIVATSVDKNNPSASCSVVVEQTIENVEIIDLITQEALQDKIEIYNDTILRLSAKIIPEDSVIQSVTWSADNMTPIKKLTQTGEIEFNTHVVGETNITVTSPNGKTDTVKIIVKQHAESVEILDNVINIYKGADAVLVANVLPDVTSNKNVIWSSKDPTIATVDQTGKVTGILGGTTIIEATTEDGNHVAQTTVNVYAYPESITLDKSDIITYVNDSDIEIYADVMPADTTNKKLVFSVDKLGVVDIKTDPLNINKILVTGKESGVALVTVSLEADPLLSKTFKVEVRRHPENIVLNKDIINIYTDSIETLNATIEPSNAYDKTVTFTSSDPTIASVDAYGRITSYTTVGSVDITVKTTDSNITKVCRVNVTKLPKGVTVDKTNVTAYIGEKPEQITAAVTPEDATYKDVDFSIEAGAEYINVTKNENVINIYGLTQGTAKVRIFAVADKTRYQDVIVYVKQNSNHIEIMDSSSNVVTSDIIIYDDEFAILSAVISPEDAYDKTVVWSSSDLNVATVNLGGVVRPVSGGAGRVTIQASSKANPEVVDSVIVEVRAKVKSIKHDPIINIYGDAPYKIVPTILPENAYNKNVKWKFVNSRDYDLADIDQDTGIITPKQIAGKVTVLGTTVDGNKGVFFDVNILIKPSEIKLDAESLDLYLGEGAKSINAEVLPLDALDKNVTFIVDGQDIVKVDSIDGNKITFSPLKQGTVKLRVESKVDSAVFKEIDINVKEHVTAIEVANPDIEIFTGDTTKINASVVPQDATEKNFDYILDTEGIITVDNLGNITPIKAGKVVVKVASKENPLIFKNVNVTVKQEAKGIEIYEEGKLLTGVTTIKSETRHLLVPVITPEDTTDKKVTWKVSDTSLATIDEDGLLTVVPKVISGTFDVTVTTANGLTKTVSFKIEKQEDSIGLFNVKDPTFAQNHITLFENEDITFIAKYLPYKDRDAVITRWWSTDPDKLNVSSGYVYPVTEKVTENGKNYLCSKPGEVTIYAEADDGKIGYVTVDVKQHVENIKFNLTPEEDSMGMINTKVGDARKFTVDVFPSRATDKEIYFSVGSTLVGDIKNDGTYTAKAAGMNTLTATSKDNSDAYAEIFVNAYYGPNSVEFIKEQAVAYIGDTNVKFEAEVRPVEAKVEYSEIIYTSSDQSVATINENGNVELVAPGKTTIRAAVKKEIDIYKEVELEVRIPAQAIEVNKSLIQIYTGETEKIEATVTPADTTMKNLTYTSTNPSIATVDQDGNVTAVYAGTAVIIIETGDGKATNSVNVVVNQVVDGIALDKTNLDLLQEQVEKITPTVTPINATNKKVIWTSSDTNVATVDQDGNVTAVGSGTAVIEAKTESGNFTATCAVTVTSPIKDILFKDSKIYVYPGQIRTPEIEFSPKVPDNSEVTWEILEQPNNVAFVNRKTGAVVGYSGPGYQIDGEVTLRVKSVANSSVFKDIKIRLVWPKVESIKISPLDIIMQIGDQKQFLSQIKPENAVIKTVKWVSSDPSIVKIDDFGKADALMPGKVNITVYSEQDPSIFATTGVTVLRPAYALGIDKLNVSLKPGESSSLNVTYTPANITKEEIVWSASAPSIVEIVQNPADDKNAFIQAISEGIVKVRAALKSDPNIYIESEVIVEVPKVESVTVLPNAASILVNETVQLSPTVLPADTLNKNVTWSSSDTSIAKVDNTGLVTGVMPGTVQIFATSDSDATKKGSATITVTKPDYTLAIDKPTVNMAIYAEETLTVTIAPPNITKEQIVWTCSDTDIVDLQVLNLTQVKVIGKKAGMVQVTAALKSDPTKYVTSNINVNEITGNEFIQLLPEETKLIMGNDVTGAANTPYKFIRGVDSGLTVADLITKLDLGSTTKTEIIRINPTDSSESPYTGANVVTGLKIKTSYPSGATDEVIIAVKGDTRGRGIVSALDATYTEKIVKDISDVKVHSIFFIAATVSSTAKTRPSALDSTKIQYFLGGKTSSL